MALSSQIQRQPLPSDLPFRVISRTIGSGAYAFIRRACPKDTWSPVIAVKFIHKQHAYDFGRLKPKQLQTEVTLHAHVGKHPNVVQYLHSSEDAVWTWIAMELADGGDLFDKIEADEGVGEDIGHFYFKQLISAVGHIHDCGVAHRDIKPENILLSGGNLKLADFGLAVLFRHNGKSKLSQTACGSPPYMAPEVVPKRELGGQRTQPYEGDLADIWSCGVVLFVLLAGNTPWDEPTPDSEEYTDYITGTNADDPLWCKIPFAAMSLLKGMLQPDPCQRFTLEHIQRHPWFTRDNSHLDSSGQTANPVKLATQMLGALHIDFEPKSATAAKPRQQDPTRAQTTGSEHMSRLAFSHHHHPITMEDLDWERIQYPRLEGVSMSQPTIRHDAQHVANAAEIDKLLLDPSASQFSQTPSVLVSVTQHAKKFQDVVPEYSLARFISFLSWHDLLDSLSQALRKLAVFFSEPSQSASTGLGSKVILQLQTRDQRNCLLAGAIIVEEFKEGLLEVRFLKVKGDPLEWRRLFKKIAILCQDGILKPP